MEMTVTLKLHNRKQQDLDNTAHSTAARVVVKADYNDEGQASYF